MKIGHPGRGILFWSNGRFIATPKFLSPESSSKANVMNAKDREQIPMHEEFSMEGEVEALFDMALTEQWYARLIGTLHLNCITVVIDAGGEQIRGTALYTVGSMFNHSCHANVSVDFPDSDEAVFELKTPVKAGEELCISYIGASPATATAAERKEALEFAHGFTCLCPACTTGAFQQQR